MATFEKDMDKMAILFKQIPFQLGVKCMETSIMEIDEAIREFGSISISPAPLNLGSWKFPQVKLEKLEVENIIRNLRNQNLPGDVHYTHLAELLIDRLYYLIISSIRFVSMLSNIVYGEGMDQSRLIGGGDAAESGFQGLGIVNPLCSDSKVFNTNMALIVRHHLGLLSDLENMIHQIVTKSRGYEVQVFSPDYNAERPRGPKPSLCRGVTQTDISSIECCEVCTISQDAIKKVGEILENCLLRVCPKKEQISALGAARVDIAKNFYSGTQWSAVNRWCEALAVDAEEIRSVALGNLKKNSELEKELKKTAHVSNTTNRDHELAISKLEKRCAALEIQVQTKKKEKMETADLIASLQVKVLDLETKLGKRDEELKKEKFERETAQDAFHNLEKVHSDLKYAHTTHSQTLRRIQQDLIAEVKTKETVSQNLAAFETSNRKYRLDIAKLKSDVEFLSNEKSKLESNVSALRLQVAKANGEAKEKKQIEIDNFKKELKIAEQKIELLTLYPDLNGPINTPESENEDVITAMENQLKGNTMRVQVLLQQSEKLALTLKKLKGTNKK